MHVLETVLRLIHPLVPFISEEIWQRIAPLAGIEGSTIMLQPYPHPENTIDPDAIAEINWVKEFIVSVRKIRSGSNIDPRKMLPVLLGGGSTNDRALLERNRNHLKTVGRIESVNWIGEGETEPDSSTALVGNMKLLIPLAGLIDKDAEILRLEKELDRRNEELKRCEKKLSTASFVDKAPEAVVGKERTRAEDLHSAIASLKTQLSRIQAL